VRPSFLGAPILNLAGPSTSAKLRLSPKGHVPASGLGPYANLCDETHGWCGSAGRSVHSSRIARSLRAQKRTCGAETQASRVNPSQERVHRQRTLLRLSSRSLLGPDWIGTDTVRK
jgi:hypothetical protein